MAIGICRVTLRLPENQSLKGKRQVLKSLIARLHNRFNVSAAEIDDHDSWQMASLGISCVSTSQRHANQILAAALSFIRSDRPDAEIVDVQTEILHGIDGDHLP